MVAQEEQEALAAEETVALFQLMMAEQQQQEKYLQAEAVELLARLIKTAVLVDLVLL
jgi:hypothetical protein